MQTDRPARWMICRHHFNSKGIVIDRMYLAGIDCAGAPNWIHMESIMTPYVFQNKEWAMANLEQCRKYFQRHPPEVRFGLSLEEQHNVANEN